MTGAARRSVIRRRGVRGALYSRPAAPLTRSLEGPNYRANETGGGPASGRSAPRFSRVMDRPTTRRAEVTEGGDKWCPPHGATGDRKHVASSEVIATHPLPTIQ